METNWPIHPFLSATIKPFCKFFSNKPIKNYSDSGFMRCKRVGAKSLFFMKIFDQKLQNVASKSITSHTL